MIQYLQGPYPLRQDNRIDILYALGTGVFIGWFLVTFQPNGTDDWVHPNKYPFLWGYGAVISSVLLLMRFLIPALIPKLFKEENWTVAKHILYLMVSFFLAITACYLYYSWFFEMELRWVDLLGFSMLNSTIIVFPLTAYVMLSYIRLLKKYQTGAARFNAQRDTPKEVALPAKPSLILTDEQGKQQLAVSPDAIFFLQSSLNYVEVYFQSEDKLKKELIRNSLQKIEAQLSLDQFVRCHRSYIVNLKKVNQVSGNAQGYKLHLDKHELVVPVSRSKNKIILDQL
ncbi:MAG: LytTR family DNA-binding domain-containing protein [Saprospiraceae bacterium]